MNRLKKYLENIAKQELDNYIWDMGEYGFPKMPYGYAAIQQYVIGHSYYDVNDVGVYPTIVINLRTGERAELCVSDEEEFIIENGELTIADLPFKYNVFGSSGVFGIDLTEGGEF